MSSIEERTVPGSGVGYWRSHRWLLEGARKRPIGHRFDSPPFHGGPPPLPVNALRPWRARNARTVILLFVAGYAERRSSTYGLCTLFLAGMVNTLLRGAALRSLHHSSLFLLAEVARCLPPSPSPRSRFLPFLLTFSGLSLLLRPSIHTVSRPSAPLSLAWTTLLPPVLGYRLFYCASSSFFSTPLFSLIYLHPSRWRYLRFAIRGNVFDIS